jgi:hypothetical protein
MDLVDREVSVPVGVWQGYGLIDQPESDEAPATEDVAAPNRRNIEHVYSLLATMLPREPLQVALRGLQAASPGLQGLAIEYLEQVLPRPILTKLRRLIDASALPDAPGAAPQPLESAAEIRSSFDDVPGQSGLPPTTRRQ